MISTIGSTSTRATWLLLVVCALAACSGVSTKGASANRPPALILISIDGFHPDYLDRGRTPNLQTLVERGARARWMQPSYPSLTFPNHYTLVTGLHPDSHGIVNNSMRDPELGPFALHLRHAVEDGRWWQGEPVWVTAHRAGLRTATLFWPGSEAEIQGVRPDQWRRFDAALGHDARVDQLLQWLDQPLAERPSFLTLYFEHVDSIGHALGPDGPDVEQALAEVDRALGRLLAGLQQRGILESTHLLVVSDHGMAPLIEGQTIVLDELVDTRALELVSAGQVLGVNPRPGQRAMVRAALLQPHPYMQCHAREDLPARWNYGQHPRVPDITCQAEPGWRIATRQWLQAQREPKSGAHGYDPALPQMRALFLAAGPAFRQGVLLPPVRSVDVYALLCRLLGIEPAPHQGNVAAFDAGLVPAYSND